MASKSHVPKLDRGVWFSLSASDPSLPPPSPAPENGEKWLNIWYFLGPPPGNQDEGKNNVRTSFAPPLDPDFTPSLKKSCGRPWLGLKTSLVVCFYRVFRGAIISPKMLDTSSDSFSYLDLQHQIDKIGHLNLYIMFHIVASVRNDHANLTSSNHTARR